MKRVLERVFIERTWKDFYEYFKTCKLPVNSKDRKWLLDLIKSNFILNKKELIQVVTQKARDELIVNSNAPLKEQQEAYLQQFRKYKFLLEKLNRYYFRDFEN